MAQLKPQKFTLESFKTQADWIGNLLSPLNQILNDLVMSYSNNLTVSENLFQEVKELSFNNVTSTFPLVFRTKFNSNPKGMTCIYLFDNTLQKYSTHSGTIEWVYLNGELRITAITGLTASTNYTIRLHLIYG